MENLFNQAVIKVKDLTVSTDTQLILYSLYKQVINGNIPDNYPEPSFFDIRGNAKYTAWKGVKNKSKNDAMREYIQTVAVLNKNLN
jgi:diazepam-binding inhibitor (GABA receptor modulating acyl-CoA-binding protein)